MVAERFHIRSLLTEDERRALALAAEGCDDAEIALRMNCTRLMVRKYMHLIYMKLNVRQKGVNRRVSAVLWYLEEG